MNAPASGGSFDELAARAHELREGLGELAPQAWLVGGVVRDALLGRPLPDVDVVLQGDARQAARALATALGGTPFPLGDGHGCWRVAREDGEHVDVCEMRGGSLADDLALRDLTINAMAVPVLEPGRLEDPLDGQSDVVAGVVRMVSPRSFDDDPLRMLRAARFAHVLDMEVDTATEAAIRERASRASEPSGERTFAELSRLVEGHEARRAMRLLDRFGLVEHLLPELERCKGLEQSRYHHLDVYEHTLAVLDNVEDLLDHPGHYLPIDPGGPAPEPPFGAEAAHILRFAALAHDLGKPETHRVTDGRVSFIGHDSVGATVVDGMCDRWATSNSFRDGVKLLVRTHLALGMLLHSPLGPRERYRFLRAVEPRAGEAILLSLADRFATAGPDDRRRWVRRHHAAARELWIDHRREQTQGGAAPLLDGGEIARAASLEPGPSIGALVRALAEEQAVGAVQDREGALAFIRASAHEQAESHQ